MNTEKRSHPLVGMLGYVLCAVGSQGSLKFSFRHINLLTTIGFAPGMQSEATAQLERMLYG